MIQIAVIGVGIWGKNYVRVLSEIESVKLAKIADLDNKTDRLSKIYSVPATTDYKEIINDKDIHGICVCTPASTHYKIVKEALEAKKHVLVEKPLTLNSQQATILVKLAKKNKLILMVGHIFRFDPAVQRLKQEIQKGTLGKIRFIYGSRMGLMTPRDDCGVIADFAVHDFDTFCFLLDKYPKEVTATASEYSNTNFEDVSFCTLRFDDNIIANVGVSWLIPKKVRDLWIIGEKCSASLDCLSQRLEIHNKGIVPEYDSFGEFKLVKQEGDDILLSIPNKEPLKEEIEHFIECIKDDKKPAITGDMGNRIVKIIEACHLSIEQKKTVMINYDQ